MATIHLYLSEGAKIYSIGLKTGVETPTSVEDLIFTELTTNNEYYTLEYSEEGELANTYRIDPQESLNGSLHPLEPITKSGSFIFGSLESNTYFTDLQGFLFTITNVRSNDEIEEDHITFNYQLADDKNFLNFRGLVTYTDLFSKIFVLKSGDTMTGKLTVRSSVEEGSGTSASGNYSHAEGYNSIASKNYSHAEGYNTTASGDYGAHAEGCETTASGAKSHAEGLNTLAAAEGAHAEGRGCQATNLQAHAEGAGTTASAQAAHAEGAGTTASALSAHAENGNTIASGIYSHAEGTYSTASGKASHSEGCKTVASGENSHSEGFFTKASGKNSHAEGTIIGTEHILNGAKNTTTYTISGEVAIGQYILYNNPQSGINNKVCEILTTLYDSAQDLSTITVDTSLYSGKITDTPVLVFWPDSNLAGGESSHTEGGNTKSLGDYSHAEGYNTIASGINSHAEGGTQEEDSEPLELTIGSITNASADNMAITISSPMSERSWQLSYFTIENNYHTIIGHEHVGGNDTPNYIIEFLPELSEEELDLINNEEITQIAIKKFGPTIAIGKSAHSEGVGSMAIGAVAHAEGLNTIAAGDYSHTEGGYTATYGEHSHAEGNYTVAYKYAHSEGNNTEAFGRGAHAEGEFTVAHGLAQHVEGMLNIKDSSGGFNSRGAYAHIVGNGLADDARSNAHTLDWNGNAWFSGDVYVGSTSGTNKDSGSKKLATEDYIASQGYVTTDTKNTAGTTDTSSKIYLVGAKSQAENPQTYSDNEVFVQDGVLNAQEITIGSRQTGSTIGTQSSALGHHVIASGNYSVAEGSGTEALGGYSHAEGVSSIASGDYSHAEGMSAKATGAYTHAEGGSTLASRGGAHAEGNDSWAISTDAHAEGRGSLASGLGAHAEGGLNTQPSIYLTGDANATTYTTNDTSNVKVGWYIGYQETVAKITSLVENTSITVNQTLSSTTALSNEYVLVFINIASGQASHVEGAKNIATAWNSHAEGQGTTASGESAHAEGDSTVASGTVAHAEGLGTIAQRKSQHTGGEYNIADVTGPTTNGRGTYVQIIGNGTSTTSRSNAHTLAWDGTAWFQGDVYVGSTSGTNKDSGSKKLATEDYVRNLLEEFARANNLPMPE